jgi:hypothetical protein
MTFLPAMAVNFWRSPLPPSGRNFCYVLISGARTALVGKYPGANGAPNASKGIRKQMLAIPLIIAWRWAF